MAIKFQMTFAEKLFDGLKVVFYFFCFDYWRFYDSIKHAVCNDVDLVDQTGSAATSQARISIPPRAAAGRLVRAYIEHR